MSRSEEPVAEAGLVVLDPEHVRKPPVLSLCCFYLYNTCVVKLYAKSTCLERALAEAPTPGSV